MIIDADDVPPSVRESLAGKRKSWTRMFALAAVMLLAVAGTAYDFYWLRLAPEPTPPSAAPIVRSPTPAAAPPAIHYPIMQPADALPLPALADSDSEVAKAILSLWGDKRIAKFFELKDIIRRVVATIDNLPRASYAIRLSPLKPVPGEFLSTEEGGVLAINPANAERYLAYVRLLTSIDVNKSIALYAHFYPLLQRAYQDLGYPNGYFNDRVIEAIDNLLDAPQPSPPTALVQPKVLYEFADPGLEARSSGQKIMMRIGGTEEARVKAKLREIRAALAHNATAR